ncbi:MAG: DNA-deoxyinosine glycosylase [Defluviitaleaceae bacterium]|nr:DNA-deoxyinosine glycosylase [Defluviitaleaceae bacterium]
MEIKITSVVHSFNPISNEFSNILILGTMPSVQSRAVGFYYSHPRNRFWQVLAGCLKQEIPQSVEDKKKLLLENGIAIWDVLAACEIKGSADSSIKNPDCNDIGAFISDKPIKKILCNGKEAYKQCCRLNLALPIVCLPSTSPANAAWSTERLISAWKLELI